ncbi:aminotransferase class III-fold pyridoxal phosphate-dependent enzyme [Bacillus tropicus]|uniref:aminotransferase class III-fold pyridoxal phosphate-dependent enzyme n=1 Tax=Bacillus tropicus TaxID=2026188 RepID=UPI0035D9CA87
MENINDGQEKLINHFKRFISEAFEVDYDEVHEDADFYEFGIDSISILQVKQEILDLSGVEVSIEQLFSTMNTIKKLTDHIQPLMKVETLTQFGEDTLKLEEEKVESISVKVENRIQQTQHNPVREKGSIDSLVEQQLEIMKMQLQVLEAERFNVETERDTQYNIVHSPKESEKVAISTFSASEGSQIVSPSQLSAESKANTNQFLRRFFIKEDHVLNEKQVEKFKELMKKYIEKTSASRDFAEQYRPIWASDRFNQGYTPQWKDYIYPIFVERAQGSRIWDKDGNEYIDFSMGFGSILLGYNHPIVAEALAKASQESVIIGPVAPKAAEVAELITELTGVERVGFYNTGSEAVMVAIRAARATTGKNKIVIFTGAFHGTFDGIAAQRDFTTNLLKSVPSSLGTPQSYAEDIIVLEYGDYAGLKVIEQHAHEIGAVLVEPVQSRRPKLQPREFLKELRILTAEQNIALIFDEIVTGFRLHSGGAQAFYEVEADIVTYGKVIGGGMPLGIIAGKAEYINRIDGGSWKYEDDSRPDMNIILSSGTFCAHPVTMAASKALLSYIKENKETLYLELNHRATELASEINAYFKTYNVPIEIEQCASMFTFKPKKDVVFLRILFYKLIEKGIYLWEGATCFVSTAHTDEDIDIFINTVKEAAYELASTGLFSVNPFTLESMEKKFVEVATARDQVKAVEQKAEPKKIRTTDEQMRLWFLSKESPSLSTAYNESVMIPFKGKVDREILKKAIQAVVNRHEILRAFKIDERYIYIDDYMNLDLPLISFIEHAENQKEEKVIEWIQQKVNNPFNLSKGPFIRIYILQMSEDVCILYILKHHIVMDGWSENIFLNELLQLYTSFVNKVEANLPRVTQFSEFENWTFEKYKAEENIAFWKQEFSKCYSPVRFPFEISQIEESNGYYEVKLPHKYLKQIKTLSRNQGVSPFITLLSTYYILIYRLTYQNELVIGVPFSGQLKMESSSLIGHCVNMLPIHISVDEENAFSTFLKQVKEKFLQVNKYQVFSTKNVIEELEVKGVKYTIPQTNVVFNMDRLVVQDKEYKISPILKVDQSLIPKGIPQNKYEIFLDILESKDNLTLRFEYDSTKISGELIKVWSEYYVKILTQIIDEPGGILCDIDL